MDLGNPASYLVLADGTPVLSSDGREVGKVEHVLADADSDVFDGVIVDMRAGPGGHRFADAALVEAIYERGVVLAMTAEAAGAAARADGEPGDARGRPGRHRAGRPQGQAAARLGLPVRQLLATRSCG